MDVSQLPPWAVPLGKAVATVAGFYLAGKIAVEPLASRLARRRNPSLSRPAARVSLYMTVLAGLFAGLEVGGYGNALGVFAAVAAAGTLAIGFAMKDTLSAFLSGVFIFVDKPFKIGDWIEWNDREGVVKDILLRTTKVETFDRELLTVPNDVITGTAVKNHTANRDRIR